MYAVVEIAGNQFHVEKNSIVKIPLLSGNPGDNLEFGNILVAGEGDNVNVGAPYINGKVSAKILSHGKDEKVLVFHKKRRKGYQKLNGHRQRYTKIEITDIKL